MPVHIVGESRLLRDMFLTICEAHEYETGHCCGSLADLPPLPAQDLVLFYSHDSGEALEAELRSFRARKGGAHLILITGDDCPPEAQAALSSYAEAVIPERKSADALIAALQVVQDGYRIVLPDTAAAAGGMAVQPHPAPRAAAVNGAGSGQGGQQHGLSEREQLILAKLTEGATNKSIANELGICEATVKVHLRTCFRKIGAKNRTQAALWASERLQPQPGPH
ncbi:response regulator transcription factor [Leisingera sp. ANG-Vp]|uniref:response regulator transcription factor n=1 Tax=Leisingera sp. ANG-Vp TaxID=1577896 RepID=UPI00057D54A7|nr:response regulator transcription factor [Leisingera sp. ANG-Vp]KIC22143.1 LuxR family transcriptional regulator [Leisingera sp. ANG-Vp]